MQINDHIVPFLDALTALRPGLADDQEARGEADGSSGIVMTKFADWGVGLIASLSFGASNDAADGNGERPDRDHAPLAVASVPPGPPVAPPQGPPVTPPQGPPVTPPQGPPVTLPQGPPVTPQGPPVTPPPKI